MTDLLFATPWWLLAGLLLVGCVLFWSGNNKQQTGPRVLGISLIVLAIALKGLSYVFETDKEKVARQTTELVMSVQSRDWAKFTSFLDPDVRLDTSTGTLFASRDALVKGAKAETENYSLTNVSAHVTDVQQDQLGITVNIDAWSEQSVTMGMKVPSSWKLNWDQSGKDWRLHDVTCLRIGNEKANQIDRLLGK